MADKVWFKIGETARLVGATPKELRYWEKVIPELRPRRSKGNLRYYHQEELARLQHIRQWLAEGLTVADCSELLRGQPAVRLPLPEALPPGEATGLKAALRALRSLHRQLGGESERAVSAEIPVEAPEPPPRRKARRENVSAGKPAPPKRESPLLEVELPAEEIPTSGPPPAKRSRKSKSEASVLGRMWSESRLPLDWED